MRHDLAELLRKEGLETAFSVVLHSVRHRPTVLLCQGSGQTWQFPARSYDSGRGGSPESAFRLLMLEIFSFTKNFVCTTFMPAFQGYEGVVRVVIHQASRAYSPIGEDPERRIRWMPIEELKAKRMLLDESSQQVFRWLEENQPWFQ